MTEQNWRREDYERWLLTLRLGGAVLEEEEQRGTDTASRSLTALNIQIAWSHLDAPESPLRHLLTNEDRRTVKIAQGIIGDTGSMVM